MTKASFELSESIASLLVTFEPHKGAAVRIDAPSCTRIVGALTEMHKLSVALERELQVHRLCEAGRAGKAAIEMLATEKLSELVQDPDGKIVRPDFGRKS